MSPATSATVSSISVKPAWDRARRARGLIGPRSPDASSSCRSRGRTGRLPGRGDRLRVRSARPSSRRRSRPRARLPVMPRGQSTRTSARISPGSCGSVCGTSHVRRTFTQKSRSGQPVGASASSVRPGRSRPRMSNPGLMLSGVVVSEVLHGQEPLPGDVAGTRRCSDVARDVVDRAGTRRSAASTASRRAGAARSTCGAMELAMSVFARVEVALDARLLHRHDRGGADGHHRHRHQHLDGRVAGARGCASARGGGGWVIGVDQVCEKRRAMPLGGSSTLRMVPPAARA